MSETHRKGERHTITRDPRGGQHQRQAELVGPTTDELVDAIEAIQDHDVPGTPPVSAVETIQKATDFPFAVGSRVVKSIGITKGRPRNGELRSDTHVSQYEIEVPLREVSSETVEENECPVCGETRATFHRSVHHNIAGSESVTCTFCDETLYSQDWG